MANINAKRALAPKPMRVDGTAVYLIDEVALAAAPSVGDVLRYRVPAGFEMASLAIQSDDLDSNGTPAIAFSVGYAPVDANSSLAANATYFAATGQTISRTGGRLPLAFSPIKFEEDVWVTVTIGTASATFAAGSIWAIAGGNQVGPK